MNQRVFLVFDVLGFYNLFYSVGLRHLFISKFFHSWANYALRI